MAGRRLVSIGAAAVVAGGVLSFPRGITKAVFVGGPAASGEIAIR